MTSSLSFSWVLREMFISAIHSIDTRDTFSFTVATKAKTGIPDNDKRVSAHESY